jgi:hypothetical protein
MCSERIMTHVQFLYNQTHRQPLLAVVESASGESVRIPKAREEGVTPSVAPVCGPTQNRVLGLAAFRAHSCMC